MAQYIDKNALVAEIERIKRKADDGSSYCNGWQHALRKLEIEINTLEVKEIDLDNEIIDYINKHYHIRFDETLERGNDPLTTIDFEEIAKHFFELGIKAAQKGE